MSLTGMAEQETEAGNLIAFQGEAGAYSHLACRDAFPDMEDLPCPSFEDAFLAVEEGRARLAMIPIENSVAGRVADIHHLMPDSGLYIVGEHFQRVEHQLLALKGGRLEDIKTVISHVHALSQCRNFMQEHGITPLITADTAGSARELVEKGDPAMGAIASSLAAEIHGLEILRNNIEDAGHNTTRFVVLSRDRLDPPEGEGTTMISFVFQVRNVPSALYKALGGFATNSVNMVKLESYQLEGSFNATQFYADIEGHPAERRVELAFEELEFFTSKLDILGAYPAHPFREEIRQEHL